MNKKQAADFLFKMWKKYHKEYKRYGYSLLTNESQKWFDAITELKRNN